MQSEIIRDKMSEIFRTHPRDHVAEMEKLGFAYCEDENDDEEAEPGHAREKESIINDIWMNFT